MCFNLQSQVSRVQWLPQFEGPHLKPTMWRKSSQWSMILRSHAEVRPAPVLFMIQVPIAA
jgi:hypothetical protein